MSPPTQLPRVGQIWRVDPTQPLDSKAVEPHFCIIVDLTPLKKHGVYVVVGITTKASEATDPDMVEMSYGDRSKTGLTQKCWALPRWNFHTKPEALDYCKGYVSGEKLTVIVNAVYRRLITPQSPPPQDAP